MDPEQKLKKKLKNSSKKLKIQAKNSKLKVWEALASFLCPSGVIKNPDIDGSRLSPYKGK